MLADLAVAAMSEKGLSRFLAAIARPQASPSTTLKIPGATGRGTDGTVRRSYHKRIRCVLKFAVDSAALRSSG